MKISSTKKFRKNFQKRIPLNSSLEKKYKARVCLFLKNPNDRELYNHQLSGKKKGFSAFSVTGDYRVVYQKIGNNEVVFFDVGTHNQVYK